MTKKQKKEQKGQTDVSGVDEFYRSASMSITKPLVTSSAGIRIFYLISALIFGLGGGIIGGSLSEGYLSLSDFKINSFFNKKVSKIDKSEQQVIVFKSLEDEKNNNSNELMETIGSSIVGIFPKKENTGDIWKNVYMPNEQIGNGLIVTADGWIITVDGVVKGEKELIVALADHKIFNVTEKMVDKATGAVFLKIDSNDLKVVKFGEKDNHAQGEELLIFANALSDGGLKVATSILSDLNYQPIITGKDFLQSTEKYTKRILINPAVGQEFGGGAVINKKGEVVGLLMSDKYGNKVLPANYFVSAVKSLLSVGEIMRPSFGARYFDLAHVLGLSNAISEGRSQGAVLYGEKGEIPAVTPESAAAKAGLKAGDIILAVNDEVLNARHSLTELIQEYKVGDVLKLDIVNQGKEKQIKVVLTENAVSLDEEKKDE